MIYLPKSQPNQDIIDILADEKKKASGSYSPKIVLEQLKRDFKNKCYICEYKFPPVINVEHFISHQGNEDKKFDWGNLFYACGHCNNTKLAAYDDILNCTLDSDNVETSIFYEIVPMPSKKAKIEPLVDSVKVKNTVELLTKVYNGHTDLKTIEAENIRSKLIQEIVEFQKLLFNYVSLEVIDEEDNNRKKEIENKIKDHLKPTSAFTAFKRWIIRDYDDGTPLKDDFLQYCK